MLILTCSSQLQRLEGALRRSLPYALPVLGAVMNINRGNPGEYEVLLDSWPDFGAVLARPRGEVPAGDLQWARGGHGEPGLAMGSSRRDLMGAVAGEYLSWTWGCWGALGARVRLDPGVRVTSLSPEHVDLLNETWTYGGNSHSRNYLAELVDRFPHVCLQDGAGQPLCWVLSDPFGTGAHGYTLPSHRRRGYMQAALTFAARRAQARGFPTFG
ncbi:GLYL3 protein, partial [Bucco capensis]|nr:GLYL3 protein [Bucco capensis]